MKITKFFDKVTKIEGKKVSVNRAQIGEVAKIINNLLDGELYKIIRKLKK